MHMNYNRYKDELISFASSYQITVSDEQADLLLKHLELVIEKNKSLNLTRIESLESGIILHIIDSLLVLPSMTQYAPTGPYLDFGTGAGVPGIPIGFKTQRSGLLDDSVTKKVTAVSEFLTSLKLDRSIETTNKRVEELALEYPQTYACVTARAVASLDVLIEYAVPLISHHGVFIAPKALIHDEELAHAQKVAFYCGLELVSRETYELPRDAGHREIFVYQQVRKPSIKLPRRVGEAKKHPLHETI